MLFWIACDPASAEVIAVPQPGTPELPTLTLYWPGTGSKAVLILIPGGEGQLNLRPGQTDIGYQFYQTLKALSGSSNPKEILDVVLFDSPHRLAGSKGYLTSRATPDHMSRIRSVIQFYREKTGKPIWLMGQSNGGVSVTEYIRYAHKLGEDNTVAGVIVSAANEAAYFDSTPLDIPILFMNHRKDGCPAADPNASARNFRKVQELDKARTALVLIETGGPEDRPPCTSGYHMYNGAGPEVTTALRHFILPSAQ